MAIKFRGKVIFDPGGVQVGAEGDRLTAIISGSATGCMLAATHGASTVTSASFVVEGITAAHKVFATMNSACDSCNITLTRLVPTADTITASFANFVGTDVGAEGVAVIHYLAILDK